MEEQEQKKTHHTEDCELRNRVTHREKTSSRDGAEYRHGFTLIILSGLTAWRILQKVQEKPAVHTQTDVQTRVVKTLF